MPKIKASQHLVFSLLALFAILCPASNVLAAPPLSLYGKLPGFEMAAISPSGEHIAMIGVLNEERRLVVIDREAHPLALVPLGDVKVRGLYWAGDGMLLLRKSNTANLGIGFTAAKAELQSMIVVPLDGTKVWAVFDNNRMIPGGIQGFHGLVERDGKYYGYFGGITLEGNSQNGGYLESARPVLYEVDLQNQRAKMLAPRISNQLDYRDWLVGPDGTVSVTFDFYSGDGNWIMRNRSGQKIASGTNALGDVDLVGLGATPGTFIYSQQGTDDGEKHWFELPLAGGTPKEILQDAAVGHSFFDKRSRQLAGYQLEGDRPAYHFYNAYQQKVIAATQKAFPGLSVHLIDWNDNFDRLLVTTEGVGDPRTWWFVDIKTGDARQLGVSYPMASRDVAPMQMIQYKAGDGMDIAAVLTLPPGLPAKSLPVVVFPHGGPTARDYPDFDWWAQAFAARGYAVLQPNFRGSSGYGAAFERAGHGEWGGKMQTDISDGLAYLVKQGIADPKRVCIMGASYGGYAALAGVTLQKGLYRCAVSVAGVSDLARLVNTSISESGGNQTVRRSLRDTVGSGKDLRAVSPVNFATDADAPILLIHGKNDIIVPYDQSNDMAQALRKAGKPVEFVTLPGEDHWLSLSQTRLAMLQAVVAFVETHNPPGPAK